MSRRSKGHRKVLKILLENAICKETQELLKILLENAISDIIKYTEVTENCYGRFRLPENCYGRRS
ncbi:hypothetical protein Hanom_Chr16g01478801 [Helianthus anomalus]